MGRRFEILSAGDSALLVQAEPRIDPAINGWCLAVGRKVQSRLAFAARDVVPGYCSVTVYFDPLEIDSAWLEQEVRALAAETDADEAEAGGVIEVPVCYGGELGPDLADVARFGSCSEDEVLTRHSAVVYRVYLLGFVPGFAYMAEVDPLIAAPRRRTPRTAVPAGSVAIAGAQTGVYPAPTPGGWNIIGRTPVKPYDPHRAQPSLFKPGDQVRFVPISPEEYHQQAAATNRTDP